MLQVNNIRFSYANEAFFQGLSFSVNSGEMLAIIGESGSGKSTLLNLIYGKFDLAAGNIYWKETSILGPKYNLVIGYEFMKYVSQEFDLMPYISVAENVGKYLSNFNLNKKQTRILELLEVVELTAFANTKVKYLSGGQKQRVALAQAIAKKPEIILLDEPFSHIDSFKKQSLRRKLFKHLKDNNITTILATHHSDDVLGFADKMLVLHKGNKLAYNTPEQLYKNPKNELIASFFGEYSVVNQEIVYANELVVVSKSAIKVQVVQSYFKGDKYLIKAVLNNKSILFYNLKPMEKGKIVCLQIIKNRT